MHESSEDDPPDRYIQKTETYDSQSHDRSAPEGKLQASVQRVVYRVGRTRGRVGRGLHSDIARKAREEASGKEGERNPRILYPEAIRQDGEYGCEYEKYYDNYLILLTEICHRAIADVSGYFLHCLIALAFLHHAVEEQRGEKKGEQRCRRHRIKNHSHMFNFECF